MFGDITICAGSIAWSGTSGKASVLLPTNRRLMVLAVVFSGPTGSQGQQVIIQRMWDTKTAVQRILNEPGLPENGIPARVLAHCGAFNPATGPRWSGARSDIVRRILDEARRANMDKGYLIDPLSQLFRTTEIPPVAGFIVNGGHVSFDLLSLNSDTPHTVSLITIELALDENLQTDLMASPFWFASQLIELGTAANSGLLWQDQINTPANLLNDKQRFLHRATRLSRFNASTGALITAQADQISLSGQLPTAGGLYFYAGSANATAFADEGVNMFCVRYDNGNLVQWTGQKGATADTADAYLSHYFTVGQ